MAENIAQQILRLGHDEDFEPVGGPEWLPTDHPAGTAGKIAVLADRVEKGQPLWHPNDCEKIKPKNLLGQTRIRTSESWDDAFD